MKPLLFFLGTCLTWSCLAPAQTSAHQSRPAQQVLDEWISRAEKEIVPAAEAMPSEKYSFAPSGGEFRSVRSFGEQVKHLSAANYQLAALILGEGPPHGERNETAPDSLKNKEQIVEYLKASFEYLHKAAARVNDDNLLQLLPAQRTRMGIIVDAVAHSYDHYGQMVEYLRMSNIVPPASR